MVVKKAELWLDPTTAHQCGKNPGVVLCVIAARQLTPLPPSLPSCLPPFPPPPSLQPSYREEQSKKANPDLMVPCFQLKGVDHEGWMNKMGGSGLTPKNWRRRWFVLKGRQLFYYKTSFVSDCSSQGGWAGFREQGLSYVI